MSNTPPAFPKGLPALLLLGIAIFGPPTAAALAFTQAITHNPWLSALLLVFYEVIVFLVGLLVKIWQKLESSWIEQVAGWIDMRVRWAVSAHRRHYYQHLIYQHRDFDVKGLSTQAVYTLELEQVFVELSVEPTPAHQASSDPIQIPKPLRIGSHSIWSYLASRPLADQHLVILGAPGSGKTTLLKHIALSLVTHKKHPRRTKTLRKLPVLLFLREHLTTLKDKPEFSLVEAIQEHAQKRWHQSVPSKWIEQQLAKGHCLILLDGLDEVADPDTRRQMAEWVEQQMVAYGQNRFIVTSRPYGYRTNPLSGVTVLEVRPFTPHQIEQFVQNWYLANEIKSWGKDDPGVRMTAQNGAQDLLRRLYRTPALFDLAVNPLLLTMIATVHRYRSSLPGKRVALYGEICEVFLGKRQEARDITSELSPAQKQQVLEPLAYSMMQKGIRDISLDKACEVIASPLALVSAKVQPEVFLQDIEDTSGLFLERDPGIHSFAHLTFQEYLAAVYVKEEHLEQELAHTVENPWWHETIRLYCAQADATPLIQSCLTEGRPSVAALTLAFECAEEALKVQPGVRTQLDTLINRGIEDPDPEQQHLAAEIFLARRLRQMVRIDETREIDNTLITNAEYQVFLEEQQAKGIQRRPDHWLHDHFPPGQGKAPILGIRPSDASAFCAWLRQRASQTWLYRLPKGEEATDPAIQHLLSEQPTNTGYWLYNSSALLSEVEWLDISHVLLPKETEQLVLMDWDAVGIPTGADWELELAVQMKHHTSKEILVTFEHYLQVYHQLQTRKANLRVVTDRRTGQASLLGKLKKFGDRNLILRPQKRADSPPPRFTWLQEPKQTPSRSYLHELARNYIASDLAYKASADDISFLNQFLGLGSERARDLNPMEDLKEVFTIASTLSTRFNLDMNRLLDYLSSPALNLDLTPNLTATEIVLRLLEQNNPRTGSKKISSPQETQYTASPDTSIFNLNLAKGFHRTLLLTFKHLRTFASVPSLKNDEQKMKFLLFLCWSIRFLALTLAIHLSSWQQKRGPSQNWRARFLRYFSKQQSQLTFEANLPSAVSSYLKTYAAFMLLEERIKGRFPAHEGILVMREKYMTSQGFPKNDTAHYEQIYRTLLQYYFKEDSHENLPR